MKKSFIITIDTEGDNLWAWKHGNPIATENTLFLQRFQDLCNKYGFKPVWLTNYEMIEDDRYVDFISKAVSSGCGELGMHLHAWNNPPLYELPLNQNGAPYLIEYPTEIIEQKIEYITKLINERTGIKPTSHRAGRWAMNSLYYDMLIKYGYTADCSVTPLMNWNRSLGQTAGSTGIDYSRASRSPYYVSGKNIGGAVLEIPMTTKIAHDLIFGKGGSLKNKLGSIKRAMFGNAVMFRYTGNNLRQLEKWAVEKASSAEDYLMFMMHSSELAAGLNPTIKTSADVEKMYADLDKLFSLIDKYYVGVTLAEYTAVLGQKGDKTDG